MYQHAHQSFLLLLSLVLPTTLTMQALAYYKSEEMVTKQVLTMMEMMKTLVVMNVVVLTREFSSSSLCYVVQLRQHYITTH